MNQIHIWSEWPTWLFCDIKTNKQTYNNNNNKTLDLHFRLERFENEKHALHRFLKFDLALLPGRHNHFGVQFSPAVSSAAGHYLRGHFFVSLVNCLLLPPQRRGLVRSHRNPPRSRARAAVRHCVGFADSDGPAPVCLIWWSSSMRASPWWLTSTSYLLHWGRSCFFKLDPTSPSSVFVEVFSSRRRWIKFVFNQDICLTNTPCQTMLCEELAGWVRAFSPLAPSMGSAMGRRTAALAGWEESSFSVILQTKQKHKLLFKTEEFAERILLQMYSYFSTNNYHDKYLGFIS